MVCSMNMVAALIISLIIFIITYLSTVLQTWNTVMKQGNQKPASTKCTD